MMHRIYPFRPIAARGSESECITQIIQGHCHHTIRIVAAAAAHTRGGPSRRCPLPARSHPAPAAPAAMDRRHRRSSTLGSAELSAARHRSSTLGSAELPAAHRRSSTLGSVGSTLTEPDSAPRARPPRARGRARRVFDDAARANAAACAHLARARDALAGVVQRGAAGKGARVLWEGANADFRAAGAAAPHLRMWAAAGERFGDVDVALGKAALPSWLGVDVLLAGGKAARTAKRLRFAGAALDKVRVLLERQEAMLECVREQQAALVADDSLNKSRAAL